MEKKGKILVVDDEDTIREGLKMYLELEGYEADTVESAEKALTMNLTDFDLILLDIMMGRMSGTELAQKLKNDDATARIPIIFLTAKDFDDDMVNGLKIGADDYIVKPFSIKNVLARIEAVLRRYVAFRNEMVSDENVGVKGIECDRRSLVCRVDGKSVRLPKKEFELLALFLENKGRIFTREELMNRIWTGNVIVSDRSIDVHVTKIRNKISPYGKHIVSRSGYGYGWQD